MPNRDLPPHMAKISVTNQNDSENEEETRLQVEDAIHSIEEPAFGAEELIPEKWVVENYVPKELVCLYDYKSLKNEKDKERYQQAIVKGIEYLKRKALTLTPTLTQSGSRKSRILEIIKGVEYLFSSIRILRNGEKIIGLTLDDEALTAVATRIRKLIKDYEKEFVDKGLAIPNVPKWGRFNNLEDWWSSNDFEVLCACYRHEVDVVLSLLAPLVPGNRSEADQVAPITPERLSWNASATEKPDRIHRAKFGNDGYSAGNLSGPINRARIFELSDHS